MKSSLTPILANAEVAGRFLDDTDLAAAKLPLERAEARLEAAEKLAIYHEGLVQDVVDSLLRRSGATPVDIERAIDRDLCLIQYCLVVGNTSPFDEWGRSPNRSAAVAGVKAEIFNYIRDRGSAGLKLSPAAAAELKFYLNYAIEALK
ncbi:hypothetical protein NEA10_16260 [Phormidium yuhuli AB48]|uniref:Bleomycin hydrolase n=1 Tax=Phormidium yuhuli AB48 TaxID=2940671 RepID=A0ABY5AQE7_9CYAN|nr:hypothetical protein [Phormidium yuhuli]USR90378.1 hypothetical protein NEA10_16260 [Phormidium yuhuli AB48]